MFICDVTMAIFCNIKSKKLQLRFYLQYFVTFLLENYSSINLQQNANISIDIPVLRITVLHQTFSLNIFWSC